MEKIINNMNNNQLQENAVTDGVRRGLAFLANKAAAAKSGAADLYNSAAGKVASGYGAAKDAVLGVPGNLKNYGSGLVDDFKAAGRDLNFARINAGKAIMGDPNMSRMEALKFLKGDLGRAAADLKDPAKLAAGIGGVGLAGYGIDKAIDNQDAIKAAAASAYDQTKDALSSGFDQARYQLDADYRAAIDAAREQAAWDSSSTWDKLTSDPSRLGSDLYNQLDDMTGGHANLALGGAAATALAGGAGALALRKKLRNSK